MEDNQYCPCLYIKGDTSFVDSVTHKVLEYACEVWNQMDFLFVWERRKTACR